MTAHDWITDRRAHYAAERQVMRFIIKLFAKDVK